ncbi:uncharacterized protein LOC127078432 [Lathyrus oleraceus]|uniref:Uncharacterized protein n=1 Tax=Pisum sativum TaxID=3888 RepID=A0A9D4WXL2_PEA|nr:uncharacterized protein LOC127078432 [Pisum sativum]KAI5408580.1 hypothetical protein KIW84_054428 [Pisum sativum]
MEGSSSSTIMDNQRLPQHENVTNVSLPNMTNGMPTAKNGVPNPHGDDLILDRETRIRLQNQGYSKTYRKRKNCHIENLEDKQNTLADIICKEIPMTEVYTNFNSVIKSEINTMEETLSEVNSNGEVLNVEMDTITNKLAQMKLSKEATEVQFIRKKNGGK